MHETSLKPVVWIGSSREDLRDFPEEIKDEVGFAIYQAQLGGKSTSAKPLKGFGGAGVLEVVEDHDGNTYRTVYTVKLVSAIYVLHAFQKKSKKGIKTPTSEIEKVKQRLKDAINDHRKRYEQQKNKS
jgi:phage-related protein